MKFLGVVKDYNGVGICQNEIYIKMNCANCIQRLLKSHGWDTDFPSIVTTVEPPKEPPDAPTAAPAASLKENEVKDLRLGRQNFPEILAAPNY